MADQKYARALGRQVNYGNPKYFASLSGAPYAGTGYNGSKTNPINIGYQTVINERQFSQPIYVVPADQPKVKVWLVQSEPKIGAELGPEETLNEGEHAKGVQANFLEVPMPELSKVLFGQLPAIGTDGQMVIYQPSTGGMWEIFRLRQFKEAQEGGPNKGDWKFANGGYHNAKTWNGIGVNEVGYVSASGLSVSEGLITLQDLVEVLRGGKIKHGLSGALSVKRNEFLAPAISHDTIPNGCRFLDNGETEQNPAYWTKGYENEAKEDEGEGKLAYGWCDAVPEGSMFRLPFDSRPSDFSLPGGPLETAIFEALREYGWMFRDGAGANNSFHMESYQAIGSPYCTAAVNPLAGAQPEKFEAINAVIPSSWTDSTLPTLEEEIQGPGSCVFTLLEKCGNEFEQIAPFAS